MVDRRIANNPPSRGGNVEGGGDRFLGLSAEIL